MADETRHQVEPPLARTGCHVTVELIDHAGRSERLECDIVPDGLADLSRGFLGEGTPLARAISAQPAGAVVPYHQADIVSVRVIAVAPARAVPKSDLAEQRDAALRRAVDEAQRTQAIMFATSFSGKWGDYDPEGVEHWGKARERPSRATVDTTEAMDSTHMDSQVTFLTLVRDEGERRCARLLIDSIRAFGGAIASSPVWLFDTTPAPGSDYLAAANLHVVRLRLPAGLAPYPFADKVFACAEAERMVAGNARSLVWIDPVCLVLRPPLLWVLGPSADAAVRPVHICNIGLDAGEPLDPFWLSVYKSLGVEDTTATVETFVEGQCIRSYFNSHAFAVNPAQGLMQRWLERFAMLVDDRLFQNSACQDVRHRVFLHQAVLSGLVTSAVEPSRLRLLPPDYSYPYNLQASIPPARRATALNDLTSIAYEERTLDPQAMHDIQVREPLRSWLAAHWSTPAGIA